MNAAMKQALLTAAMVIALQVALNQFEPTREFLQGGNRYYR